MPHRTDEPPTHPYRPGGVAQSLPHHHAHPHHYQAQHDQLPHYTMGTGSRQYQHHQPHQRQHHQQQQHPQSQPHLHPHHSAAGHHSLEAQRLRAEAAASHAAHSAPPQDRHGAAALPRARSLDDPSRTPRGLGPRAGSRAVPLSAPGPYLPAGSAEFRTMAPVGAGRLSPRSAHYEEQQRAHARVGGRSHLHLRQVNSDGSNSAGTTSVAESHLPYRRSNKYAAYQGGAGVGPGLPPQGHHPDTERMTLLQRQEAEERILHEHDMLMQQRRRHAAEEMERMERQHLLEAQAERMRVRRAREEEELEAARMKIQAEEERELEVARRRIQAVEEEEEDKTRAVLEEQQTHPQQEEGMKQKKQVKRKGESPEEAAVSALLLAAAATVSPQRKAEADDSGEDSKEQTPTSQPVPSQTISKHDRKPNEATKAKLTRSDSTTSTSGTSLVSSETPSAAVVTATTTESKKTRKRKKHRDFLAKNGATGSSNDGERAGNGPESHQPCHVSPVSSSSVGSHGADTTYSEEASSIIGSAEATSGKPSLLPSAVTTMKSPPTVMVDKAESGSTPTQSNLSYSPDEEDGTRPSKPKKQRPLDNSRGHTQPLTEESKVRDSSDIALIPTSSKANSISSQPPPHFPSVLHHVLSNTEGRVAGVVLEWLSHGKAFRMLRWDELERKVLPEFFPWLMEGENGRGGVDSFLKHLRAWGFEEVKDVGPDMGSYRHDLFLRGFPNLCQRINPSPTDEVSSTTKSSNKPSVASSNTPAHQRMDSEGSVPMQSLSRTDASSIFKPRSQDDSAPQDRHYKTPSADRAESCESEKGKKSDPYSTPGPCTDSNLQVPKLAPGVTPESSGTAVVATPVGEPPKGNWVTASPAKRPMWAKSGDESPSNPQQPAGDEASDGGQFVSFHGSDDGHHHPQQPRLNSGQKGLFRSIGGGTVGQTNDQPDWKPRRVNLAPSPTSRMMASYSALPPSHPCQHPGTVVETGQSPPPFRRSPFQEDIMVRRASPGLRSGRGGSRTGGTTMAARRPSPEVEEGLQQDNGTPSSSFPVSMRGKGPRSRAVRVPIPTTSGTAAVVGQQLTRRMGPSPPSVPGGGNGTFGPHMQMGSALPPLAIAVSRKSKRPGGMAGP